MIKALGLNSPITREITESLVLGQYLPSSLEVSKIISNKEFQGRLRGMRDIPVELKNSGLIAGMSVHLIQSSPQTMDGIMVHKHVVYSVLHRVKRPTQNNAVICISLIKLGIGFIRCRIFPKNPADLALSTKIELKERDQR